MGHLVYAHNSFSFPRFHYYSVDSAGSGWSWAKVITPIFPPKMHQNSEKPLFQTDARSHCHEIDESKVLYLSNYWVKGWSRQGNEDNIRGIDRENYKHNDVRFRRTCQRSLSKLAGFEIRKRSRVGALQLISQGIPIQYLARNHGTCLRCLSRFFLYTSHVIEIMWYHDWSLLILLRSSEIK
jgi:hypothetical protein